MREIFLALFFIPALAISTQPIKNDKVERAAISHQILPGITTHEYELANGLKIFITPNKKAPNVAIHHWVKVGSLHEKSGTTGLAHLFEHMMFRPVRPGDPTFFDHATRTGAQVNANTRFEATLFDTRVPKDKTKLMLKMEADRFKNLVVTKELLDIERKAVWSEYSTKFDANPVLDLWFQLFKFAYPGHAFGWTIIGFREDLDKINAKDCNQFFQSFYGPQNTGLFITGDVDANDIFSTVKSEYSDWKRGFSSELPKPFNKETQETVGEGKLPSKAKFILFGFRTPYRSKEDIREAAILNSILFDDQHGLVKKRLVDDKQIAAEVSSWNFSYDNGMIAAGIVGLPNTNLADIKNELSHIKDDLKKMSDQDFAVYKRNFHISYSEAIQRNVSLGLELSLNWGKYGDLNLVRQFAEAPLNISKDQVLDFMQLYFKPENMTYITHPGQSR